MGNDGVMVKFLGGGVIGVAGLSGGVFYWGVGKM